MNKFQRENLRKNFIDTIKKSWIYKKMTKKEQITVIGILQDCGLYANNIKNIYMELNNIYLSFLYGLGYKENPITWRE